MDRSHDKPLCVEAIYGSSRLTPTYTDLIFPKYGQQYPDLVPAKAGDVMIQQIQRQSPIVMAGIVLHGTTREVREEMGSEA